MALTLDQIARRRGGIGGSDVAAVVGMSPWATAIDVWQAKTQAQQPHPATPATQRGDFLEPALREWYAFVYDRQVQLCDTMQHPEYPIVLATPDGISEAAGGGDPVLMEIKSPGPHTQRDWGEDGTDQIPLHYLPQVTWTMAVAQLKHAHVVALVYGELRVYQVPYEPELFDELYIKAELFWRAHVKARVPPPVDSSKSYADYLARKFRRVQEDAEVVRGKRVEYWAARLEAASRRMTQAELSFEHARNQLKELMGEAERAECALGHVTWRQKKGGQQTDWKALAAELQIPEDVIARHTRIRPAVREFRHHLSPPSKDAAETERK